MNKYIDEAMGHIADIKLTEIDRALIKAVIEKVFLHGEVEGSRTAMITINKILNKKQ